MRICIIGAGNMGGSIAEGIASSHPEYEIRLTNHSGNGFSRFSQYSNISCSTNNIKAVEGANIIIIAVKPAIVAGIIEQVSNVITANQILVSVANGISLEQLEHLLPWRCPLFRVMPNIAVSVGQSMTFIAAKNETAVSIAYVKSIFESLGKVAVIQEKEIPAVTAICSCGIAFAMRYIRAAMQGAICLGIEPDDALNYILQTIKGATELIEATQIHPEAGIDKVATPGGITIRGLIAMENKGFSAAVVEGMLAASGSPRHSTHS